MALQILDGLDYRKIPRFADDVDPRDAIGQAEEMDHAQKLETKNSIGSGPKASADLQSHPWQ